MGEKKFTLLELHVDGETQIGPSAIPDAILGGRIEGESTTDEDEEAATDDGGSAAIAVVVGLIALVAIAVAVRKFRNDDEEPLESPDERDVVVS